AVAGRAGAGRARKPGGGARFALAAIAIAAAVSLNAYLLLSNSGWAIRLPGLFASPKSNAAPAGGSSNSSGGAGSANGSGAEAPVPALSIPYDSGEGTQFCLYRSYIAECSRDGFILLDKDGREVFKKNIDYAGPSMKKAGDYLLVYDIGGRSAFVMDGKSLKWEDSFASGIVNADVSEGGYVSVILGASGYRNSVRVFAPFGKKLFDWVVAEDYVVAAVVSPSGDELMLNRVKAGGLSARSGLEFLDLRSEPFAAVESGDGEVFLSAAYLGNGGVAAATETGFALYSGGRGRELVAKAGFGSIMAVSALPRNRVAVAAQSGGIPVVMEFASKAGEPGKALFKPDLPVLNMASGGSLLLVNMGSRVAVLRDGGKPPTDIRPGAEVLYGDVSGNSEAMAVTGREALIYKIG
ncbi:MAG: DUF5711 family protein, partial [Clostridiales bacterium]|nr:DUF5711 family protein [Clostridiales bacterium]